MGPTASGKSEFSIALIEALAANGRGAEIISVDSAQVYRGMDIGTAKPDAQTQARVRHHLIDICDPAEPYSAARFAADAEEVMAAVRARGNLPLLVGGTMLYFRALTGGLSPLPGANPILREKISARAQTQGWPALHRELHKLDPETALRLHPNDGQRIQRALEVIELSGKPLSILQSGPQGLNPGAASGRFLKMAIVPPSRAELHARIEKRLNLMFKQGFVEEVSSLYQRGDLQVEMPSIRSVGYRQVWDYLAGNGTLELAQRKALEATRQFAKRQITWLRSEADVLHLGPALAGSAKEFDGSLNFDPKAGVREALKAIARWPRQASC